MSDLLGAELWAGSVAGDERAFGEIYERHVGCGVSLLAGHDGADRFCLTASERVADDR